MTLIQDSASLATENASETLAVSSPASSGAVTANVGADTGSDTTGSSSSGGSGATDSTFGGDTGEDTVELTAAASSTQGRTAAAIVGDSGLPAATAGTTGSGKTSGSAEDAAEQSTAALVEISGASSLTVEDYLMSVPPNLATATALTNQLTNSGQISYAAASSVYTLLDSSATLALTSE